MYKLRIVLPEKSLTTVYYTLIKPHLLYGIAVWGASYKTRLNRLQVLQTKSVKCLAVMVASILIMQLHSL